jgi:hypothetical protein
MRYEWEDNITLDVPDGWTLNEPGNLIELVPPDESGALHVTILERERRGEPKTNEAMELVQWFQSRRGADAKIAERYDGHVSEAWATFDTAEDGEPMSWSVLSRVWPEIAVLASYSHNPRALQHDATVEKIFRSIQPVEHKK